MEKYVPYLLPTLGVLIALTNLTVEVIKQIVPNDKFPTNIIAVITAMIFTIVGFFAFAGYEQITIQWYYIVGAIVGAILVAYGAMFGYDKLKEIIDSFKT